MDFPARKTSFADFQRGVKGQLWGQFWHKPSVIHSAVGLPKVVHLPGTTGKRGCAQ